MSWERFISSPEQIKKYTTTLISKIPKDALPEFMQGQLPFAFYQQLETALTLVFLGLLKTKPITAIENDNKTKFVIGSLIMSTLIIFIAETEALKRKRVSHSLVATSLNNFLPEIIKQPKIKQLIPEISAVGSIIQGRVLALPLDLSALTTSAATQDPDFIFARILATNLIATVFCTTIDTALATGSIEQANRFFIEKIAKPIGYKFKPIADTFLQPINNLLTKGIIYQQLK